MYKIAGIQNLYIYNPILTNKLVTNLQVSEQSKFSQTDSELLMKFINSVSIRNQNTAKTYHSRLLFFARFAKEKYGIILDEMIQKLRENEFNPYDILNDYCFFLKKNDNLSSTAFRDKIITSKIFLEFNDIELSPKKFKLKVRFPQTIFRHKEAIDKEVIIKILNGCSDLRLKTYVMLLASTGLRATEALSIRLKDLDITPDNDCPSKTIIRGEYTKTKVERYVFLTREMQHQMKIWIDYKYRKRRICHIDKDIGKNICEYIIPEKKQNDLIFSLNQTDNTKPELLYYNLAYIFSNTLDRIGMGDREDENQRRRKITLHTFRRFVKTTISDLGYADYSEWFIGHSGSTYWRKKDNEKAEIFQKIEPYLTFLNIQQLKRQGADLETKIEELKDVNQALREKDKMKEDVIANLSDKLIILSQRLDAIERTNNKY